MHLSLLCQEAILATINHDCKPCADNHGGHHNDDDDDDDDDDHSCLRSRSKHSHVQDYSNYGHKDMWYHKHDHCFALLPELPQDQQDHLISHD